MRAVYEEHVSILGSLETDSSEKGIGPFSAADRKQMMLSDITQNGMRITGTYQC